MFHNQNKPHRNCSTFSENINEKQKEQHNVWTSSSGGNCFLGETMTSSKISQEISLTRLRIQRYKDMLVTVII